MFCELIETKGELAGAFKVEKLLQLQNVSAQTDACLKPSSQVLTATITAMSRARDSNKGSKPNEEYLVASNGRVCCRRELFPARIFELLVSL